MEEVKEKIGKAMPRNWKESSWGRQSMLR